MKSLDESQDQVLVLTVLCVPDSLCTVTARQHADGRCGDGTGERGGHRFLVGDAIELPDCALLLASLGLSCPVPRAGVGRVAQACCGKREFFIDNLLVRIHFFIVMIRWNGLASWEFEFPFPGSLTYTFLVSRQPLPHCSGPRSHFVNNPQVNSPYTPP